MGNTEKTMQNALLNLFISLGEMANQTLISSRTADQWYEYYCASADREVALREENSRLRAEIAALCKPVACEMPVIDFPVKEDSNNEDHE